MKFTGRNWTNSEYGIGNFNLVNGATHVLSEILDYCNAGNTYRVVRVQQLLKELGFCFVSVQWKLQQAQQNLHKTGPSLFVLKYRATPNPRISTQDSLHTMVKVPAHLKIDK